VRVLAAENPAVARKRTVVAGSLSDDVALAAAVVDAKTLVIATN
jgi:hypothetical protein